MITEEKHNEVQEPTKEPRIWCIFTKRKGQNVTLCGRPMVGGHLFNSSNCDKTAYQKCETCHFKYFQMNGRER